MGQMKPQPVHSFLETQSVKQFEGYGLLGNPIQFDFQNGRTSDASPVESAGMFLMRTGAQLTGTSQFYGFSYIARAVRTVFRSSKSVRATMASDFIFEFPYGDAYWGRLLDNSQLYEENVLGFLHKISDCDYAFIDCGANYGFVSAFASSSAGGGKPTIAIEADGANFELLATNRANNNNRFEIRHSAIFSQSGKEMQVYGKKHEAFSVTDNNMPARGLVTTLAVKDLGDWVRATSCPAVVIKLDVEGAEIAAIDGIGDLGGAEILIIYEDHGSDRNHTVSRYLKDELDYQIFDLEDNNPRRIDSYDFLDSLKTNRRYGYDFLATKSEFWLGKISELS